VNKVTCHFCDATESLPYNGKGWELIILLPRKSGDVKIADLCPIHKNKKQEALLDLLGGVQLAMKGI